MFGASPVVSVRKIRYPAPFMGGEQTGIAPVKTGRYFVEYETDEEYAKLAKKELRKYCTTLNLPIFLIIKIRRMPKECIK